MMANNSKGPHKREVQQDKVNAFIKCLAQFETSILAAPHVWSRWLPWLQTESFGTR
jgi:hypothetical protein